VHLDDFQANISWKYQQIESTDDYAKKVLKIE
jgi:hypothetical protein